MYILGEKKKENAAVLEMQLAKEQQRYQRMLELAENLMTNYENLETVAKTVAENNRELVNLNKKLIDINKTLLKINGFCIEDENQRQGTEQIEKAPANAGADSAEPIS